MKPLARVAVLHPGEMGSALGRLLVGWGVDVVCPVAGRSERTRQRARDAGFTLADDFAAAVRGTDLVVSLVPPAEAVAVARQFAACAGDWSDEPPLYLDANSVSPMTASEVGAIVTAAGARFVDGSLHGRAQYLGMRDRCVLFLSGPEAEWLASALHDVLDARVCGRVVGAASSLKMSLGAFSKGLVALFVEIASAWGAAADPADLVAALTGFYPETVETLRRLLPSYPMHAGRRVQEIEEVARWYAHVGTAAPMAEATREVLAGIVRAFPARDEEASFEETLAAVIARGVCRRDPAPVSR